MRRSFAAALVLAVASLGVLSAAGERAAPDAGLKVYFVSVGQGDAEYIELPDGQNVLIDGGPGANPSLIGDPPIAKFLSEKGISRIDHVVLTHPHADHFVGLQYVFAKIKVGSFYDTRLDNSGSTADDAVRAQAREIPGIRVSYPAPGDALDWGPDVRARVLNSCPDAATAPKDPNSCSIVLRLSYRGTSVLFTGDMPSKVEAQVVSRFPGELASEALKVGHHGSAGSSSAGFLDAVKPKVAYIEVGTGNPYGHPKPEALARLQAVGARVYRTDIDGTRVYEIAAPRPAPVSVAGLAEEALRKAAGFNALLERARGGWMGKVR